MDCLRDCAFDDSFELFFFPFPGEKIYNDFHKSINYFFLNHDDYPFCPCFFFETHKLMRQRPPPRWWFRWRKGMRPAPGFAENAIRQLTSNDKDTKLQLTSLWGAYVAFIATVVCSISGWKGERYLGSKWAYYDANSFLEIVMCGDFRTLNKKRKKR